MMKIESRSGSSYRLKEEETARQVKFGSSPASVILAVATTQETTIVTEIFQTRSN